MHWLHFPKIASTHLFAKQHVQQLINQSKQVELHSTCFQIKALITCDEQTCGIGRRGNRWHSRSGDLLATYLLDLPSRWPRRRTGQIALAAACALFDALANFLGDSMRGIWIKWPNDLYLDDWKFAGVLAEQVNGWEIALLSIGVNLAKRDELLHSRSSPHATLDRRDICPKKLAEQLSATLPAQFQRLYQDQDLALLPVHLGLKLILGATISFCFTRDKTKRQRAIYRGIDGSGQLIVQWKDGLLFLRSEQVCKVRIESS